MILLSVILCYMDLILILELFGGNIHVAFQVFGTILFTQFFHLVLYQLPFWSLCSWVVVRQAWGLILIVLCGVFERKQVE